MKLACAFCFISILALGTWGFTVPVLAIAVGQVDDFEDGTLENWTNNAGLVSLENGGPAGAGDNFMQVIAFGGDGPGSRLTAFNLDQWLGDYVAAKVTAIEMDLQNLGDVDLTIRLGFKQLFGHGAPGYLSAPFSLPVEGGWQHAIFLINPASVTAVNTQLDFNTFFANGFSEFRIINEVGVADLAGEPVAGQIGIDNIHAVGDINAVPESIPALLTSLSLILPCAAYGAKRKKFAKP